jgi:hypothetical protein
MVTPAPLTSRHTLPFEATPRLQPGEAVCTALACTKPAVSLFKLR